jgi:hypothetical protein
LPQRTITWTKDGKPTAYTTNQILENLKKVLADPENKMAENSPTEIVLASEIIDSLMGSEESEFLQGCVLMNQENLLYL